VSSPRSCLRIRPRPIRQLPLCLSRSNLPALLRPFRPCLSGLSHLARCRLFLQCPLTRPHRCLRPLRCWLLQPGHPCPIRCPCRSTTTPQSGHPRLHRRTPQRSSRNRWRASILHAWQSLRGRKRSERSGRRISPGRELRMLQPLSRPGDPQRRWTSCACSSRKQKAVPDDRA
jgi:hypothetical protein